MTGSPAVPRRAAQPQPTTPQATQTTAVIFEPGTAQAATRRELGGALTSDVATSGEYDSRRFDSRDVSSDVLKAGAKRGETDSSILV